MASLGSGSVLDEACLAVFGLALHQPQIEFTLHFHNRLKDLLGGPLDVKRGRDIHDCLRQCLSPLDPERMATLQRSWALHDPGQNRESALIFGDNLAFVSPFLSAPTWPKNGDWDGLVQVTDESYNLRCEITFDLNSTHSAECSPWHASGGPNLGFDLAWLENNLRVR